MGRFAVTVVFWAAFVFSAVLIAVVASVEWDGAPAKGIEVVCVRAEDREIIRGLAGRAVDDAFERQIEHLYAVWMKDLHDQPRRAQIGTAIAVKAWVDGHSMVAQYNPPECR